MSKTVIVTPSTHWDREWVQTQFQYQIRLVKLIDNLMDLLEKDSEFKCFQLDGQTSPIEDYLQIKPENKSRLSKLIKEGRILIGPWYVLADQFLQNGESTIRNLIFGRKQCLEMGAEPMNICYIPDSFGSIETMPMIAAGFGLKYAMFGRGRPEDLPTDKRCFTWVSPDGNSVLAANHPYWAGLFLSYPTIMKNIHKIMPNAELAYKEAQVLLPKLFRSENCNTTFLAAGVDHMEPRAGMRLVLDELNAKFTDIDFKIAGPETYFNAVADSKVELLEYSGEFRGADVKVFNGCTSSRIYQKQANFYAQRALQVYLEPLATIGSLLGEEYPKGLIDEMWRQLLLNHPHDSICGCSIDRVHEDIDNRFARIEDASTFLIEQITNKISSKINTMHIAEMGSAIVVFNTLSFPRSGWIHQMVKVPYLINKNNIALFDENGNQIPGRFKVVAYKYMDLETVSMTTEQLLNIISKNAGEEDKKDESFTILEIDAFFENIPSFGFRTYQINSFVNEAESNLKLVYATENGMNNDFLEVTFNANGTFNLLNKETSKVYKNLHHFEDSEDIGDAYGYRHYENPKIFSTLKCEAKIEKICELPHRVTWRVTLPLQLPAKSFANERSTDLLDATVISEISLLAKSDTVDIVTTFKNNCENHRFRAIFNSNIQATHSSSEGNFSLVRRKVLEQLSGLEADPQQNFVDVKDNMDGLAFFNCGLPEYEAFKDKNGNVILALTLLRAVGELGKMAGSNHLVPDAQCLRSFTFNYSVRIFKSQENEFERVKASRLYANPLLAEGTDRHTGTLETVNGFFNLQGPAIPTALKVSEKQDGVIMRYWNPTSKNIEAKLISQLRILSAENTNLNEDEISSCISEDFHTKFNIPTFGLSTIKIKLQTD